MKSFFSFFTNNWWLKLLALLLAIVIYHALKNERPRDKQSNDRIIFKF